MHFTEIAPSLMKFHFKKMTMFLIFVPSIVITLISTSTAIKSPAPKKCAFMPRMHEDCEYFIEKKFNITRTVATMINVRSVLFSKDDVCKECWSLEDLKLLTARRIMQDLIPRKVPRNFRSLNAYIKRADEVLKLKGPGRRHSFILTMALYDALGGYLHTVAIPALNEAYYAGNVDYKTAEDIHLALAKMMTVLNTDGSGWAPPCDLSRIPTRVHALPMAICNPNDACRAFVHTRGTSSTPLGANVKYCRESRHAEASPQVTPVHNLKGACLVRTNDTELKILLPFLDDHRYPSAIAVPLKDHALFSLMSSCAVNVIPKYYILAMRCLSSPEYAKEDIFTYNTLLYKWIVNVVLPHVYDLDRWYPGFGGVMRVLETMNQKGLVRGEQKKIYHIKSPLGRCPLGGNCIQKLNDANSEQVFDRPAILCFVQNHSQLLGIILGFFASMFLFFCTRRYLRARRRKENESTAYELTTDGENSQSRRNVTHQAAVTVEQHPGLGEQLPPGMFNSSSYETDNSV